MQFRISLLFILIPFFLFAQQKPGHAPYLQSHNARKLSEALTSGYADDSMKVRSIYLWMTHHIKYDVRNYQKGRPSYDKPKKILFHRKAVCLGYSILFDSLCYYAGINSEMVPGYTYAPWYEARDTFFLDDHAWNVAQVNGEWKLYDVTWGSGYVKPRKQVVRKILWAVSRIPYYQKYRFKKKPSDLYYETPAEIFIQKHLPSTPAWQLLPCSVPIDSFQLCPNATGHFLRGNQLPCKEGNDSIPPIFAESKNRQEVIMGKQAIFYNNGNHQDLSLGYYYYAETIFNQAENKKEVRLTRIALYDSTMHQLDSARKYFDSTAVNAKQELNFFLARNKRMRRQVVDENKPLIAKHNLYRSEVRHERIYAKSICDKLERENRHLHKQSRQFKKIKLKTKRPKEPNAAEVPLTKMLLSRIDSSSVLIATIGDSTNALIFSDKEPMHYSTCIEQKKDLLWQILFREISLRRLRKFFLVNSYDTLMINSKAMVFDAERKVDSLNKITLQGKDWHINKNDRAYAEKVKAMQALFYVNAKACKQLAHLSETSYSEDSVLALQKKQFNAWNDSLIRQNEMLIAVYKSYRRELFELKFLHRIIIKKYHKEIGGDISRASITNASFRHYYGGIHDSMKHNAGKCNKLKSYSRVKRNKLQFEENKAEKQALKDAKKNN